MDDPDLQMDAGQGESQSEAMEYDIADGVNFAGVAAENDNEMEMQDAIDPTELREAMLEGDAEMAAELQEQEMKSNEREWADRDAEQRLVDTAETLTNGGHEATTLASEKHEAAFAINGTSETDNSEAVAADASPLDVRGSAEEGSVPDMPETLREAQADEVGPVQYDVDEAGNGVAEEAGDDAVADVSKPPNEVNGEDEEHYADV